MLKRSLFSMNLPEAPKAETRAAGPTKGFMGLPGAKSDRPLPEGWADRRKGTPAPKVRAMRPRGDASRAASATHKQVRLTLRQRETMLFVRDRGGVVTADEAEGLDGRAIRALSRVNIVEAFGGGLRLTDEGARLADAEADAPAEGAAGAAIGADEFRARGEAAFGGWGWQARLARSLGVSRQTVAKWTAGRLAVPEYVVAVLDLLDALREAHAPYPARFRKD